MQISANGWVIALEDSGIIDNDFNDLVVEVHIAPVPVPAAIYLLGAGMLGLIGIRRKFRKSILSVLE